jgi:STE24 endopeptidase
VVAAALVTGAVVLWSSSVVPGNLHLSGFDASRYFAVHEVSRAERFGRFMFADELLALVAVVIVLAAYARWGARWMRESAAGRIGTGMLLGMIGLAFTWFAQLPFGIAQLWWARRHGLATVGYLTYVVDNWLGLAGEFLFICLALLIVMALARPLGERWWIVGGPFFVGLALLFAFVQPYLIPGVHRLRDPDLAAAARVLERREGVAPTPVEVQRVSSETSAPNAEATGMGPSRRVILWDTLLDGRFTDREVRVVIAHELGHLARSHIWKLLGWYAIFAIPGAYLIARFTRRRGGMARPEAVPLGLFMFVALGILALPAQNAVTRHIEAEADWMALEAARDPAAQVRLMQQFTRSSLEEPNPNLAEYLLFENHPTLMQRIAMAEEWKRRRQATSAAQSP